MEERLVDVLNDRNTVLHVFPVALECQHAAPKPVDFEQKALKAAVAAKIVPETQSDKLHARLHIGRGGPLQPFADALQIKSEQKARLEQRIRERAYFLWQEADCPESQADAFWHRAHEVEGASDE